MVTAWALLLQALVAMPLAVRLTADMIPWAQFGGTVCTTTAADSEALAHEHGPVHPPLAHHHAQCLICQGHALPLTLLAVVLCALLVCFGRIMLRAPRPGGPVRRRDPYQFYHSRAPPVAA